MFHCYISPKLAKEIKTTHSQAAYKKHGDLYLGTIDNIDLLDESMRGKPLPPLAEVVT